MDFAFLPIVIIIVFALVTPILSYLTQRRFKGKIVACWSIIGLTSSLIITLWEAWAGVETRFLYGNIIVVDSFSIFFSIIFITVATLVAIASYEYDSDIKDLFPEAASNCAGGLKCQGESAQCAHAFP